MGSRARAKPYRHCKTCLRPDRGGMNYQETKILRSRCKTGENRTDCCAERAIDAHRAAQASAAEG